MSAVKKSRAGAVDSQVHLFPRAAALPPPLERKTLSFLGVDDLTQFVLVSRQALQITRDYLAVAESLCMTNEANNIRVMAIAFQHSKRLQKLRIEDRPDGIV